MPILLPPKQTAKAVRARKRETVPAIDWLGLWAISLGLCAVVLAGIADVMGDDNIGAAFILIGAPRSLHSSCAPTARPTSKPSLQAIIIYGAQYPRSARRYWARLFSISRA